MSGIVAALDAPDTVCALESHRCTLLTAGRGGFDQHHPIRYLVECLEAGAPPAYAVVEHFTVAERGLATAAVSHWDAAGRPAINGWPCPAARA